MTTDTRERIMQAAALTVQDLGYGGLSFRELAKDVGIKSASIHYHFTTKGDLGAAILGRYTDIFADYLDGLLERTPVAGPCMDGYTGYFGATLRNANRMCLAGILGAERNDLPAEIRAEIVRFGDMNEHWVARVLMLDAGAEPATIRSRARAIFSAVSGAQLVAHSRNDVAVYDDIVATYRASGLIP